MSLKLKDLSIYISLGVFFVGTISAGAVAKRDIDDGKEKITKLEAAQIAYQTETAIIKTQTENLKESVDELKQDIKDGNKALLEAIQKKR